MTPGLASYLAEAAAGGSGQGFALSGIEVDRLWYYVVCAVAFTFAGLITGYFIWRKGAMQMHDAEAEIQRTSGELKRLSDDLKIEESAL